MLTAIENYCNRNIPGVQYIEYAPIAWINTDAWEDWTLNGNHQIDVSWLSEDYNWLRCPLLGESIRWEEGSRTTSQGTSYPQQLGGTIPHMRVDASEVIEETEAYQKFLLRLTDRNGKVWIIGTPESPMSFAVVASSGVGEGANNYRVEFTGEAARRAKGFQPIGA